MTAIICADGIMGTPLRRESPLKARIEKMTMTMKLRLRNSFDQDDINVADQIQKPLDKIMKQAKAVHLIFQTDWPYIATICTVSVLMRIKGSAGYAKKLNMAGI